MHKRFAMDPKFSEVGNSLVSKIHVQHEEIEKLECLLEQAELELRVLKAELAQENHDQLTLDVLGVVN